MKENKDMNEGKIINAVFSENEVGEFSEVEKIIRSLKPEDDRRWEEMLSKKLIREKKNFLFYWKSAAAASIFILALVSSIFFSKVAGNGNEGFAGVFPALVSEMVMSYDGGLEPTFDDVLSSFDGAAQYNEDNFDSYVKEIVGENDENDLS